MLDVAAALYLPVTFHVTSLHCSWFRVKLPHAFPFVGTNKLTLFLVGVAGPGNPLKENVRLERILSCESMLEEG